jgi:hypothetical protein
MDDINDIVSFKSGGGEPAAKAEVVAETPKVEEVAPTATQERDESGKFKAKEEAKSEPAVTPPVETQKPVQKDSVSALIAMRTRLQAAENRVKELEAGKAEKPDIFTDPEKAVGDLVNQQVAPIREKFFKQSINAASKTYDDFQQAAENFSAMMESNPILVQQLRNDEDPGEFIYRIGSNTPEFREAQAAKTRETLSAKDIEIATLRAEIDTLKKTQQTRNDVPESLNRQPSGAIPDRDSDTDIKNIVRFKSG